MNHETFQRAALLASLFAATAAAQDQATTLLAAAQKADVVVHATVTAVTDPSPEWRRLELRVDEALKGTAPLTISLTEPGGECCGRSLFALQVGDERLMFLRRVGPTLHTFGGGRGVLPATPSLLAHTRALLATDGDDAAATALLVAHLGDEEPRIAADAAMALAAMPDLQLDGPARQRVTTQLQLAVARGSTRTAPLADLAVRLGDPSTLDAMLPIYLQAQRPDQARLLRSALERGDAARVANRLTVFVGTDRRSNLRAAELLAELPASAAQPTMTTLLRRPNHPRVQLHLCEGLLCAGVAKASLEPMVPAPVLQLAEQRLQRRRTFRNITPDK